MTNPNNGICSSVKNTQTNTGATRKRKENGDGMVHSVSSAMACAEMKSGVEVRLMA
jgi:hypothetical protein